MPPRTLLDIAGVARRTPSFAESVLILIDHQMEYRVGALVLSGIEDAIIENQRLLAMARAAGAPVIHVVQCSQPGSAVFEPSSPMSAVIPELAPCPGEAIVEKRFPSSFAGTNLAEAIAATGRRSLIITGFMTHMCVSTTVRAALDHGLECTVVAAATATRDLPDPLNGIVPAEIVQHSALAALADRFALVVKDSESLAAHSQ
ncbi:MAG TPA: cysteine hydrolase family protein [Bryobacteraceae bacterium]|nr:cysteine hydrolase family protein [Bryobacteraceae bacterium]